MALFWLNQDKDIFLQKFSHFMKFLLAVALLLSFSFNNLSAQDIDSLSAQDVDSPKLDLHLNLLAGDSYLYSISTDQKMTQEITGNQIEMNQKSNIDYKYTVESNDGESIKIKATCEKMQLSIDYPGNQIEYDSELKGSDSRLAGLDNITRKSFYLFLDTKGNIYKTEGFKELGDEFKSNEFGDEFRSNELIKNLFTDSALITSLHMDIYPDNPISIGTSWKKLSHLNLMSGKLQNDINYTLEGTSEDIAWINVKGDISGLVDNSSFKIDLKGTQTGTLETDLQSGLISDGTIQMEIEANIQSLDLVSPMKLSSETRISSRKL